MPEAWIQLQCPTCEETWEANPADLPAPKHEFTCTHCGATHPISEFAHTQRGLEILESVNAE